MIPANQQMKQYATLFFLVLCSFLGYSQAPTTPSTNFSVVETDGNRIRVSFTPGDGAKRIIVAKALSPVTAIPTDGADYTAGAFGLGNELAQGEFVVYDGTGYSYLYIEGLIPETTYYFKIFEYNGTDFTTEYLTSSFLEASSQTLSPPTIQASNIQFSNILGSSMTVSWTRGNGQGCILIAKEGSAVDIEPEDLINYSSSSNFGTGSTQIGTGNYALYEGAGTSDAVYNLKANTTYHFALFEYNGSSGRVYLTSTSTVSVPGATASQSTTAYPTLNTTFMNFSNVDGDRFYRNISSSWFGNGLNRLIIARAGSPVTAVPVDGTSYAASTTFGNGDEIAPGEFVMHSGTNGGNWVYGLEPETTYYFKVFEYNGSGTETFYLVGNDTNGNPPYEASQATLSPPTIQASDIQFSNIIGTSMTVSWTRGNGQGSILIAREGSAVDAEPQNGINYSSSSNFGTASTQIGTGNYALYEGAGTSDIVYNLKPNTTYHFALFEYNGENERLYLTSTSTVSTPGATASQSTTAYPTLNTTFMNFSNV
ncbi:hypothetical protein WJN01_15010, partial [Flavobacteriaceae bacterium SZ-1-7]|uniref:hypothetical protein n=1 Tax=Tamlana sedimenti TaxID=3134126 RepID=UPI0031247CB6